MQVAQIPLLFVWTFACHNSIWTFLLGIPFERALFWHKFMVWLSLGLGAYHGILGQLGKGEDHSTRVTGTFYCELLHAQHIARPPCNVHWCRSPIMSTHYLLGGLLLFLCLVHPMLIPHAAVDQCGYLYCRLGA